MKKRFREALSARCKDMGLTDKAIDNLTEIGCKGLADTSTDEEIGSAVDAVVPFAKEMQAEITRKTSKKQSAKKQSEEEGEGEGGQTHDNQQQGEDGALSEVLKRISKLENENKALREERTKAEKKAALKAELKGQGISEFFADFINIPDDADVKDYVTKFKQSYVSANLPSKGQAEEQGGGSLEQRKQEAEDWVKRNFKVD